MIRIIMYGMLGALVCCGIVQGMEPAQMRQHVFVRKMEEIKEAIERLYPDSYRPLVHRLNVLIHDHPEQLRYECIVRALQQNNPKALVTYSPLQQFMSVDDILAKSEDENYDYMIGVLEKYCAYKTCTEVKKKVFFKAVERAAKVIDQTDISGKQLIKQLNGLAQRHHKVLRHKAISQALCTGDPEDLRQCEVIRDIIQQGVLSYEDTPYAHYECIITILGQYCKESMEPFEECGFEVVPPQDSEGYQVIFKQ